MSIVSQIKEEVSKIADTMGLQILEAATQNLTHDRFNRLRRGTTIPRSIVEENYLYALKNYVYFKRKLQRSNGTYDPDKSYDYKQMMDHRTEMDRIEFGFRTFDVKPEERKYITPIGRAISAYTPPEHSRPKYIDIDAAMAEAQTAWGKFQETLANRMSIPK